MSPILRSYKLFSVFTKISVNTLSLHLKRVNAVRSLCAAVPKRESFTSRSNTINKCLVEVEKELHKRGRISCHELQQIQEAVKHEATPTGIQVLLLIRCCGSVAVSEKIEGRMQCLEKIWNYAVNSGIKLDVSHYNAYLKVCLENEAPISSMEFLQEMEQNGVLPNRVTYQNLLAAYCRQGDLEGATEILEEMKKKSFPLNENVFNSLIMGHCFANDVIGAEGVLKIMRDRNLIVNSTTYTALLCGLAKLGKIDRIEEVLKECAEKDIVIKNTQLSDIVYYLAVNGYTDHAKQIIEKLSSAHLELIVLTYRLLHKRQFDLVIHILRQIVEREGDWNRARFVLRYLARYEDADQIRLFKNKAEEKEFGLNIMATVLHYCLINKMTEKSLLILDDMYRSDEVIKTVHFWPLLAAAANKNNTNEILEILRKMKQYGAEIRMDTLTHIIFRNLNCTKVELNRLMGSLNVLGISKQLIIQAYIASCFMKGDIRLLSEMSRVIAIPFAGDKLIEFIINNLRRIQEPKALVDFIYNFIIQQKVSGGQYIFKSQNYDETTPTSDMDGSVNERIKEFLNALMTKINSNLSIDNSDFMKELLEEMIEKGLPISNEVSDLIKENCWSDAGIKDLATQLVQVKFNDEIMEENMHPSLKSHLLKGKVSKNTESFRQCCEQCMLDEAEALLKDDIEIQTPVNYVTFLKQLKKANKEEKFIEYLKRYCEKFSNVISQKQMHCYVVSELFNTGLTQEALQFIANSDQIVLKSLAMEILEPCFGKASIEDSFSALNILIVERHAIEFSDLVDFYSSRNIMEKLVDLLEYDKINTIISRLPLSALLAKLYNSKNMALYDRVVKILEQKFQPNHVGSYLLFCYSCSGDIKKGCALLGLLGRIENSRLHLEGFDLISSKSETIQAIENALTILRDDSRLTNAKDSLYTLLIKLYVEQKEPLEKGMDLWHQVQEDNVPPSGTFLRFLADFLKMYQADVPFEVPISTGMSSNDIELLPEGIPTSVTNRLREHIKSENYLGVYKHLKWCVRKDLLGMNHIRSISKWVQNTDGNAEIISAFRKVMNLIRWKHALAEGYITKFVKRRYAVDTLDEGVLQRIPHRYLCSLLLSNEQNFTEKNALAILWIYFQKDPKFKEMADLYYPAAKNVLQDESELDSLLRIISPLSNSKNIIEFLLTCPTVNMSSSLRTRAEEALKSLDNNLPINEEPNTSIDISGGSTMRDTMKAPERECEEGEGSPMPREFENRRGEKETAGIAPSI